MDVIQYPNDFWRGIANKDFISNGVVLPSAFKFDDVIREDGYKELSINWNDCDEALEIALNQRKQSGKLQFSAGIARLELSKVQMFLHTHIIQGDFGYERREVDGNPYHGNLLVSGKTSKVVRSLISNGLALIADTNITYQPEGKE